MSVDHSLTVSIIMPVYNGQRYLREAIDSVLAQTEPDWELIVVDDGSIDTTGQIVAGYADQRIRYLRQVNTGRSAARNRGLHCAAGQYVLFLDSDDTVLPECLETHLAYLSCHPQCGASISDCEIVDESGHQIIRQSQLRQRYVPGFSTLSREGTNILDPLVVSAPLIGASNSVMVRRGEILAQGAQFDPEMFMGEDWDFWLQLAENIQFGFLDKVTCRYRWHRQNTVSSAQWTARRASLLRGRQRVLNSVYFSQLTPQTRWLFFYQILFDLMPDNPDRQRELLSTAQFDALEPKLKVHLLRLAATHSSVNNFPAEFTGWCFQEGTHCQSFPFTVNLLGFVWRVSPGLLKTLIQWRQRGSPRHKRDSDVTPDWARSVDDRPA